MPSAVIKRVATACTSVPTAVTRFVNRRTPAKPNARRTDKAATPTSQATSTSGIKRCSSGIVGMVHRPRSTVPGSRPSTVPRPGFASCAMNPETWDGSEPWTVDDGPWTRAARATNTAVATGARAISASAATPTMYRTRGDLASEKPSHASAPIAAPSQTKLTSAAASAAFIASSPLFCRLSCLQSADEFPRALPSTTCAC